MGLEVMVVVVVVVRTAIMDCHHGLPSCTALREQQTPETLQNEKVIHGWYIKYNSNEIRIYLIKGKLN